MTLQSSIVTYLLGHSRMMWLGIFGAILAIAFLIALITGGGPVHLSISPFFMQAAGFDISWTLIPFSSDDPYLKVLFIGIINTLFLAIITMVAGVTLGTALAAARFYGPKPVILVVALTTEVLINTPFVLQIFAWFFGIFSGLPQPRQSYNLLWVGVLNNRGLYLPAVSSLKLNDYSMAVVAVAMALSAWGAYKGGQYFLRLGVVRQAAGLLLFSSLLFALLVTWRSPILDGFNYRGGWLLPPGLCAMILALTINNAAYSSEIIRSGLNAVPHGQYEAARALGLNGWLIFTKVILPQAMRVVIPPMINQSQDVLKNCSLSIIVGYPEIITLWVNISLNQSGRAMEIMVTTMSFYVACGLVLSRVMSRYPSRKGVRW